jgi:uncharacterized protein (TIGR00730 family)
VKLQNVAVYCGSSPGRDPVYADVAAALGRALAERGIGVVYGGGRVGLMGSLADAALAACGTVTGVITEALMTDELANRASTELITVGTMHERKLVMSELADAFVMLPGGFGTLDEFFEALTWAQLGIHSKPCAVLDPSGYYESLFAWIDRAVDAGFVAARNRGLVLRAEKPEQLLNVLEAWQPATYVAGTPVDGPIP